MKILVDINIILDVLLLREPFQQASTKILSAVEKKKIEGYICSTSVTTIYYLINKSMGAAEAEKHIENLLKIFKVTAVDKITLLKSLKSGFHDYEDAVIHQSAVLENLDGIVTRNTKDFKHSKITVYDPLEFAGLIDLG